jgi:hypothetical protein
MDGMIFVGRGAAAELPSASMTLLHCFVLAPNGNIA